MNKITAVFLLVLALPGCDVDDKVASDADDRSLSSLLPYSTTRVAHTLEGAGGDLQWIQFIANGISEDPASMQFITPGVPASCNGATCDQGAPHACYEARFGRDAVAQEAELDAFVADASARFGVNLADPSHYFLLPYEARGDVGIRAMAMSGVKVPADGFKVHDCGWQAVAIDGVSPSLNQGSYRIDAELPGLAQGVVLNYRLREPVIQAVGSGGTPISIGRYNVTSEVYGEGLAEFVVASECEGTLDPIYSVCFGTINHNIRNAITFSDRGGL